jgi:hypothetical protein
VVIAVLDENDPNYKRSFALRHNLNASLVYYCKLHKMKKQAAKQTKLEKFCCLKTVASQPSTLKSLTEDMEVNVLSGEGVHDPLQTVNS